MCISYGGIPETIAGSIVIVESSQGLEKLRSNVMSAEAEFAVTLMMNVYEFDPNAAMSVDAKLKFFVTGSNALFVRVVLMLQRSSPG